MGSLDEQQEQPKEVSKCITIALPKSNPNMRDLINTELDNGWHLATSFYDTTWDELRIVFT